MPEVNPVVAFIAKGRKLNSEEGHLLIRKVGVEAIRAASVANQATAAALAHTMNSTDNVHIKRILTDAFDDAPAVEQ